MESAVKSRLESVRFGAVQAYKNIAIVPLICPEEGKVNYLTLGEALASWNIAVTEVSAKGEVPELMVVNRGNQPVLLIDGEELAGAKQNRVLNISILLKESSKTRIPVSCTEHGRWSYASKVFQESGNVMAYKTRSRKTRSVHRSLQASGAPVSDQKEVWDSIAKLQVRSGTPSPTAAMSDVFKAREEDLHQCEQVFRPVPNQVGLVAVIDGKAAGLDVVSLSAAYARLHPKLVRNYVLEALLDASPSPRRGEGKGEVAPDSALRTPHSALAKAFLDDVLAAQTSQFPSVGYGTDVRFQAKRLAGTALVHDNEVIHAAFFRLNEQDHPERMA
jgi:hypothetical protein